MVSGRGHTPSFRRERIQLEDLAPRLQGTSGIKSGGHESFLKLIDRLEPGTFAIYYESKQGVQSGHTGYLIIHFPRQLTREEQLDPNLKWHDAFAQTWYGVSGWMS